jgi:hypothetical protein
MHSARIVQKLANSKIIDIRRMPIRNLQSNCIDDLYRIAAQTEKVCADIPKAAQARKRRIDRRNFNKMAKLMRKKGFDDLFVYVQCAPFVMAEASC